MADDYPIQRDPQRWLGPYGRRSWGLRRRSASPLCWMLRRSGRSASAVGLKLFGLNRIDCGCVDCVGIHGDVPFPGGYRLIDQIIAVS